VYSEWIDLIPSGHEVLNPTDLVCHPFNLRVTDIPDNQLSDLASDMKRGFLNNKKVQVAKDKTVCDNIVAPPKQFPPSGDCSTY